MRSAWIIAKRDLGSFFNSPIFYVVTTVFLIIYSFIFFNILNFFSFQSFQAGQLQAMGINLNLNEMVIEPSLQNMSVILLMIIPIITMRSFADEKKMKTFRLLLSSPVHLREIILGKFLACMIVVAVMILISSYSVGFLFLLGEPEPGPVITGYLGVLLMAGCFVSVGIFASSLTDNQIIAAVLTFGFSLFMWVIGWGAQAAGSTTGQVLQYISIVDHLERFLKGLVNTSDLVYYLSFILFNLFLCHRVLDSNRWR
ncbi:MAG: ABC transporter permease subunit [Nitrospina sp.]|nr:ABC transporter permease subunit [Nitrospina sp.]MBT3413611.1 ABC transporter permease subunit [Nitrospina sp.]MBT3856099.1 ABC transporter permease subunit [Nitrospina sp.]MBT4388598.1 ABC transporter permease subunit [Nitrospina sp.]MBT4621605.1 ABC transporter permease subunit [Nitrospina sp.]